MKTTDTGDILSTLGDPKRKHGGKRLGIGIVLLLLILGVFAFFMKPNEGKVPNFQTAAAVEGDITVLVSATGTLEPTNEVQVGSETSGTIREVLVDFNSRVKKGQILAKLIPLN